MRQGKWIVLFLTLGLIMILGVCISMAPLPEALPENSPVDMLYVEAAAGNHSEKITLWKNPDGVYCVFLPGYAQLSQAKLRVAPGCSILLDGETVSDGRVCGSLSLEKPYTLEWTDRKGGCVKSQLVFYRASSVPAVYVDVRSGSMDYIHRFKGNEEPGSVRIYLPNGTLDYRGDLESVKGRGNATWEWEKKPYNMKLRTQGDLLGMGAAQNWVLLANTYDPSHLRNRFVYETAGELGLAGSPQCCAVDLYLNGEYAGLYLLTEKNEIHPQRVNIPETTGNLISIEKKERLWEYGADQFVTPGGTPVRIRSTTDPEALQQTLQAAERAILSPDGVDPQTGRSWKELLDGESWAKKYLIEEVFGNLDAGYISQFFYWDTASSGKIFAGPVWDYDVTMGIPGHWQLQDVNMLYAGRPHLENWEDSPWFYALYQKPEFREMVTELYRTRLRPLLTDWLEQEIPDWEAQIRGSARMDQLRWNGEDALAATEQLTDYMHRRLAFLDSYWLSQEPYCLVQLYIRWHVIACYAIPAGTCVPEQEVPAGTDAIRYVAWCDEDTGEIFDFSQPVTKDCRLYLMEQAMTGKEPESQSSGLSGKIKYIPSAALCILFVSAVAVECGWLKKRNKRKQRTGQAGEEEVIP